MSSHPHPPRRAVTADPHPGDAPTGQAAAVRLVVLSEQALGADDAARIARLHDGSAMSATVLVPADTRRSLLADVLDHLSLLELRGVLDAVRGRDETSRPEATAALSASLQALRGVGVAADGEVVEGDPLTALAAASGEADEVVVVTRPHAVEDTFHTDWASRARQSLGLPVLHVYAGSSWVS